MISEVAEHEILGQHLLLLPQKAIYWKEEKTLIISDLHFGKAAHFRKAGIAVPNGNITADILLLGKLIQKYLPETLIFLGDLFHSDFNSDWNLFSNWRKLHPTLKIILVKGNHDIIPSNYYSTLGIEIINKELYLGPFEFAHHPFSLNQEISENHPYRICGHLHPGIRLAGKGRQTATLSCFFFSKNQAILPAFGSFTGNFMIKPTEKDHIFCVVRNRIMSI